MKRLSGMVGVISALVLSGSAFAQTAPSSAPHGRGTQAPGPTNLQVLPKDMQREQLLPLMQNIAAALGVRCNYCHVQEGRGGRNDMASDEKPMKKTARAMMRLVGDIRHMRKNDKDAAIKDLETAIDLDPDNSQAKQQLQQLKGA